MSNPKPSPAVFCCHSLVAATSATTCIREKMGVDWIVLPQGKGRFVGPARGVDDKGHDLLEVELSGQPSFYGEYRALRDASENFDVEISSFGFSSQSNAGNKNPGARHMFSDESSKAIEAIIVALCNDEEARRGIALFSSRKAYFLGRVHFAPGWIRKARADI
jgi:hypothetical protein